jgi:hypothetical protein
MSKTLQKEKKNNTKSKSDDSDSGNIKTEILPKPKGKKSVSKNDKLKGGEKCEPKVEEKCEPKVEEKCEPKVEEKCEPKVEEKCEPKTKLTTKSKNNNKSGQKEQKKVLKKENTESESDDYTENNNDKKENTNNDNKKLTSYNPNQLQDPKEIDRMIRAGHEKFDDFSQLAFEDMAIYFIKHNTDYKKELKFDANDNIIEKDEINMAVVNSYRPSTIVNSKDLAMQKKTKGCSVCIYTQDLKSKHEDKLYLVQQTDVNLQAIKYHNQTHRFLSSMTVPPNMTINLAFDRLCQNTLWMLSHAFVINIFGGSYSYPDDSSDFISSQEPIQPDRIGPLDWSFVSAVVKTNYCRVVVFNHYGSEEQYKYFRSCPFRRIQFFDENGNFMTNNKKCEQYSNLNKIYDKSQYVYRMDHVRKLIFDLINNGVRYILLNLKYDLESDMENEELFKQLCHYHNIHVIFQKDKITVYVDFNNE